MARTIVDLLQGDHALAGEALVGFIVHEERFGLHGAWGWCWHSLMLHSGIHC